jgi:hypothetical protein
MYILRPADRENLFPTGRITKRSANILQLIGEFHVHLWL